MSTPPKPKGRVGTPTIGAAATDAWVEPPAVYDDVRAVLASLPHPPSDATGTGYGFSDLFTVRHALIRAMDPPPRSVFEFGALYGYFLVTALDAAPSIRRVGWVDDESHTAGSNRLCAENVASIASARLDGVNIAMTRTDVRKTWRADLVQVDGDHTYDACLADLQAAELLEPRWIMIDDWEAHGTAVQPATEAWLRSTRGTWDLTEYETVNGLALLTKRAP